MAPLKFLLFSMLLFSIAVAFSAPEYLYPNEKDTDIATVDFLLPSYNSSFSLVKIGGNPVFLLKDGQPIQDAGALQPYLNEYSAKYLQPSASEITELKTLFNEFNASRNALTPIFQNGGTKFAADDTCQQVTGLKSIGKCTSAAQCDALAGLICSNYGAGSGCPVAELGAATWEYSQAVMKLDSSLISATGALSNIGASPSSALDALAGTITPLKDASAKLAASKLRMPIASSDKCTGCRIGQPCWNDCSQLLYFCPSVLLTTSKLDTAAQKITTLKSRVAMLADPSVASQQVAAATAERITYKQNVMLAAQYSQKYNLLANSSNDTVSKARKGASLVFDSKLSASLASLDAASADIEGGISTKKFDTMESSLSKYSKAVADLKGIVSNASLTAFYDKAQDAQDDAGDSLISAKWKVDSKSKKEVDGFNALLEKKKTLDATFTPPLTNEKYAELTSKYATLRSDTTKFTYSLNPIETSFVSVGAAASATSVNGAMSILSSIVPINFKMRAQIAPIVLPGVLLLTDASLLSVILIVFVFSLVFMRNLFKSKLVLAGWICVLLAASGFVLIGSVGLFFAMQNSTGLSSFSDFYAQVQSSPRGVVVIDSTGSDDATKTAMASCAGTISSQLEAMNKTSVTYRISGNTCQVGSNITPINSSSCLLTIPDVPIFYLKYSQNESVHFDVVAQKQATVSGPAGYHARCDIGNVLG